jgi:hypothetical protein
MIKSESPLKVYACSFNSRHALYNFSDSSLISQYNHPQLKSIYPSLIIAFVIFWLFGKKSGKIEES